ncbi:SCO7613 C-terminal domain-containing membrane protein [Paramicrobacterium agarici]|uniref:SCO7613 C-terminal domain-containing membrane protein n=1 Tax=Paramicrobacterium agarici TaxID=630514 RepID=UPI0011512440|nr:hypothetical protein [Microbacterium agarici]TQO24213.1 hypothetical protein FB385_3089 [Microbacterium agarici]
MADGVGGTFPRAPRPHTVVIASLAGVTIVLGVSLTLALAVAVPPVWHFPVSIVFAAVSGFGIRTATHRRHHGLATILVCTALLPIAVSQWTVWQSGLAESALIPTWLYVGAVNVALTALLVAAGRWTSARAIPPFAVIAAALALVGIGASLFPAASLPSRMWAGAVLVASVGAAWPLLIGSLAARVAARSIAAIASIVALVLATASWPSLGWGTSIAFLVTAAAFAMHLFGSPVAVAPDSGSAAPAAVASARPLSPGRLALTRELGAWKTACGAGLGLAAAGAGAAPAAHFTSVALQLNVTAVLTATAAVVFATIFWRLRHNRSASGLRLAGLVTLVTCSLTVVPALGIALIETWTRIALPNFSVDPFAARTLLYPVSASIWVTAACLTASTAVTLALWRRLREFSWLPLGLGGATLLVAQASAPTPAASVVISGGLAIGATALFVVLRPRRGRRVVLTLLVLSSIAAAFLVGANSAVVWPFAAFLALGCAVALRVALPRRVVRADKLSVRPALSAVVVVLVLISARWLPLWADPEITVPAPTADLTTIVVASAILIIASTRSRRFAAADITVMSALATIASLVSVGSLAVQGTSASQRAFVIGLACVLAAELSWQFPHGGRDSVARYVTAALTPPTAVMLAVESWRRFGPPVWGAPELLAVGSTVVLAGLGIVIFRGAATPRGEPRSHPARLAWDSSIALTSTITIPAAVTTSDFGPLHLVLLGVLPVLFSLGEGSVARSSSRRRHLIWACLPPFAGAIWLGLAERGDVGVELSSLALAALVCAALAVVVMRRPSAHIPTPPGRNLLAVATLAIFFVPAVFASAAAPLTHTYLILLIATLLAGVGAFLPPVVRGVHIALWLWSAGALTVGATTSIRSYELIARTPFKLDELLVWTVAGSVLMTGLATLWLYRGHRRARLAYASLAIAPLLLSLPFANVAAVIAVPGWMLSLVAAGATMFLAAPLARGSRAHSAVTWMTTLGASFLAVGTITGAHSAVEFVSIPVGVIALTVNLRALFARAEATSWRMLGAPLAALILPSLVQCLSDPAPARIAWLVLGIAATAAFGVVARLQAPIATAAIAGAILTLTLAWPALTAAASGWAVALAAIVILMLGALVVRLSNLPAARAVRSIARMR